MPTIELSILLATVAFTLSAAAGLGGSLILVPALAMLLGAKQGVAIAALLLALNNVAKTVAYRDALPLRDVALVVALTALGAAVGARMLLAAPEGVIQVGIVVSLVSAALIERRVPNTIRTALVPLFAFGAGATSGFTGTAGPLKAVALRSLGHDRLHFVGAASLVSLSADAVKAALLIHALPVAPASWAVVAGALPAMPVAAFVGRRINQRIGEQAFSGLFWTLIAAYSIRLLAV